MSFDGLNMESINLQIGYTTDQISNLKKRIKTGDFKSSPISGLKTCIERANKSLADLDKNLKELQALKKNYNTTGKGKKIS